MDGAVFPPCSLAWSQTMIGVMVVMATSFKRTYAAGHGSPDCCSQCPDPVAGHYQPTPPLEIPGHSQASLAESIVGSLLHSSSWCTQGFAVPSKGLFPRSCRSSMIKSHWASKSNPWSFSVPLLDHQVGKSVVGPRTFAKMQELLWYNCSPVCGSSAWQLCGGTNGNLLQEDLCHTPCLPGLLQPEPLSPGQATADLCLHWRHSDTQRQVCLSLLWRSLILPQGPGIPKVFFCLHPLSISGGYEVWF